MLSTLKHYINHPSVEIEVVTGLAVYSGSLLGVDASGIVIKTTNKAEVKRYCVPWPSIVLIGIEPIDD